MRARFVLQLAALAACGPKAAPRSAATEIAAGPPLRLRAKAGDHLRGRVSLAMDVDMGAGQAGESGGQHLALAFTLATVEEVQSVGADGTADVWAHVEEIAGAASQGGDQRKVDQFAAALAKVGIGFARGPRGEVGVLELSDLAPPLTDSMVRPMLNAVFAAQRGAILPEASARPGATWTAQLAFPPHAGFDGGTTFQYQLVSDESGRAVIACDAVINGQGGGATAPRRIAGRSSDEYKLDVASGRFVATRIDTQLELEQTLQTTVTHVKQHVRAEWTRTD